MVINKQGSHCGVSVDGHTEVGVFELHQPTRQEYADKQASLWGVRIFDEFQGNGYAHVLMRDVESEAMNMSADCIWLNVMAGNRIAIHVYEEAGFHRIRTHFDRHAHFTPEGHALVDAAYIEFKMATDWGDIRYFDEQPFREEYRDFVKSVRETHLTWHECRPNTHEMVKYI